MTEEIPFAKSAYKDSLMMLDCSTRRSIVSTVASMKKKGLKENTNKKWVVKHLRLIQHYSVLDRISGVEYFVIDYEDKWLDESGFGVYKKEEKK